MGTLPSLKFGKFETKYPVIQAGMGVRVAAGKLAGTVIKHGGVGVIASVGLCKPEEAIGRQFVEACNSALRDEIKIAREISGGKGPLGVNIMVALTNYEELARTAVDAGIDFIISGAGLPVRLPAYVPEEVALIPVISSGRAAGIVLRTWRKKYNRKPAAIVIEGPLCGGHLGFSNDQIENPDECSIDVLLQEVKDVLKQEELDVPLLAAESVKNKADIDTLIAMGFDGVQVGTRFILTEESGVADASKEVWRNATVDDVVVMKSPVGMPVRVLKTPLVVQALRGESRPIKCPYKCLITCDFKTVPFCIANALVAVSDGDVDNGIFMTGLNISEINDIISVEDFFKSLD